MNLLFGFKGRINRVQWFLGQLLGAVFYLGWITYAMRNMLGGTFSSSSPTPTFEVFDPLSSGPFMITAGLWCWIYLATTSKRLHDHGFSGMWAALGLLPMASGLWMMNTCPLCSGDMTLIKIAGVLGLINYLTGPLMFFFCAVKPGDPFENEYGPPPGQVSTRLRESDVTEGVMPPSGLARLDDAYFERYRSSISTQQSVTASPTGPAPAGRPVFGKR